MQELQDLLRTVSCQSFTQQGITPTLFSLLKAYISSILFYLTTETIFGSYICVSICLTYTHEELEWCDTYCLPLRHTLLSWILPEPSNSTKPPWGFFLGALLLPLRFTRYFLCCEKNRKHGQSPPRKANCRHRFGLCSSQSPLPTALTKMPGALTTPGSLSSVCYSIPLYLLPLLPEDTA